MITYEIHPAIGIARIGSSRLDSDEGFFNGPEPDGSAPASYRDSTGNLKRQAARRPGEVTQYNAVPWQADFLSCQWEEFDGPWPRRLGWWPAQRPDDVYPHVGATDMVPWARGLGDDYQDMIDHWDRLGIVINSESHGAPFFVERERDTETLGP